MSVENTAASSTTDAAFEPQQDTIPKSQEEKPVKKRPRPAQLDLKSSNHNSNEHMSQYAMKCLSPGLPPLNPTMQSTFLISKSIEAQQRQLIASRQTPTGLTAPLESLSIPSSTKRLKRNAPPPLNLSSSTTPIRPTIMSAPSHHYHQFQQFFTPHTASKPTFNNTVKKRPKPSQFYPQFTPMTPYGVRRPHSTSIPYHKRPGTAHAGVYARNGIKTGIPKSAIPPRTGIPRTAVVAGPTQGAARYRGFRMKREEGVVDVFTQGERMAPLVAQPLSAQREFFDHGEISMRNSNTARIPPSSAKSASAASFPRSKGSKLSEDEKINEDSESDDVESNAIEPEAKVGLTTKSEVVGELKILNNVFRFGFARVADNEEEDKQRFLNHCSRAWEEFVKLGN